jgi:hypothetical protein
MHAHSAIRVSDNTIQIKLDGRHTQGNDTVVVRRRRTPSGDRNVISDQLRAFIGGLWTINSSDYWESFTVNAAGSCVSGSIWPRAQVCHIYRPKLVFILDYYPTTSESNAGDN